MRMRATWWVWVWQELVGEIRFDRALEKSGKFLTFNAYVRGLFDARRLQVQAERWEIHCRWCCCKVDVIVRFGVCVLLECVLCCFCFKLFSFPGSWKGLQNHRSHIGLMIGGLGSVRIPASRTFRFGSPYQCVSGCICGTPNRTDRRLTRASPSRLLGVFPGGGVWMDPLELPLKSLRWFV